jgi:uncharacterized protein
MIDNPILEDEKGGGRFRFSPRPNRADEIEWRAWGEEAFIQARRDGKLVLLSISAAWCHWCHVMDETTYSDERVIETINRDYIPVRVDSDRRPDINTRYNQGGWPTTAFLLPTGRAVAGLTYSPPEQFRALLERLAATYRHRGQEIRTEAAALCARERELLKTFPEGCIDEGAADYVREAIIESWDRENGGIGGAPKFPPFGALDFALWKYEEGDEEMGGFCDSTLRAMGSADLYDDVEGGFFRYATGEDWTVPHYEKMLSDNARMIEVYLAAAEALARPDYVDYARGTLDYVLRELLDDERRGFYGSQDADEEYYLLDSEGRGGLDPPPVDTTIFTDSSAMMIKSFAFASAYLDDQMLLATAEHVADHIWREGFRHGTGVCHYFLPGGGDPGLWGQPSDQVHYLGALLELYQATGGAHLLERAIELGDLIVERYTGDRGWLCEAGLCDGDEGRARESGVMDDVPLQMPDIVLNGVGARYLLMLEDMATGRGYAEAARGVLEGLAGRYRSYTHYGADYATAVKLLRDGFIEIRVSFGAEDETREDLFTAAEARYSPRKLTRPETVDDYVPSKEDVAPPPAVVCTESSCVPVGSADELRRALATLVSGDSVGPGE